MLSDNVSNIQIGSSETNLSISTVEGPLFSRMNGVYAVMHRCKPLSELFIKIKAGNYSACATAFILG